MGYLKGESPQWSEIPYAVYSCSEPFGEGAVVFRFIVSFHVTERAALDQAARLNEARREHAGEGAR